MPIGVQSSEATEVPGEEATLQLLGFSIIGKKTMVSISNPATKQNRWIGVGDTVDGIHVLNYDLATDQCWVRVGGELKQLAMAKSSPTQRSNATDPSGIVQASARTLTPEEAEQEMIKLESERKKRSEEAARKKMSPSSPVLLQ